MNSIHRLARPLNRRSELPYAPLIAGCVFLLTFASAKAELPYTVTDLGTLGGSTSTASGISGQQAQNAAGMIVGSSSASDNSEHAFLYVSGQMFDLNNLCDLSTSDFKVLTAARSINDACLIIGEGLTTNGQKHAFLLTPTAVDGGQWQYVCCQWVWIQEGGGWWWETNCRCYKWHGGPGDHPPCPPTPPHCWWPPLPCPPECGCKPPPCWCCIDGEVVELTEQQCRERGGQCYATREEALKNCQPQRKCWCCINGEIVEISEADCRERGGQCYSSPEEAKRDCKQRQRCWICINGKVIEVSGSDSRIKDLRQCFGTREEALRYCEQQRNCWVCQNGVPVQLSEAECQQRSGPKYRSREEALQHCRQPQTGWCCVNGRVAGGVTSSQCEKSGGQWFPSESEARAACQLPPLTHVPPGKPGRDTDTKPRRPHENGPTFGRPSGDQSPNDNKKPKGRKPNRPKRESSQPNQGQGHGATSLPHRTGSSSKQTTTRKPKPTPTPGKP